MARFLKKIDRKLGQSPGTVTFVGQRHMERPRVTCIEYGAETLREESSESVDKLDCTQGDGRVLWLNVDGLHDEALIEQLGQQHGLSPLVLEDVVDTGRRPKMEDHDEYVFISLRMLSISEENRVQAEALGIVVFEDRVLTFQERSGDVFDPVRVRLRRSRGRIRQRGATYLAYALMDSVVENYIRVIEALGERIEELEQEVLDNATPDLLEEILEYRREMAYIRKQVRPVREVVRLLAHPDDELFGEDVRLHLHDLADLAEQSSDAVDVYREMIGDALATYNMVIGNKLNDVMKFLTVFATIFIPLTFIAGVYGMNFQYMPELRYPWAYPALLAVMTVVAGVMLAYFKRRGWM